VEGSSHDMTFIKVLLQHLSKGTKENHKSPSQTVPIGPSENASDLYLKGANF
jgi:hypothetical protein